jgi:hypothetical protein
LESLDKHIESSKGQLAFEVTVMGSAARTKTSAMTRNTVEHILLLEPAGVPCIRKRAYPGHCLLSWRLSDRISSHQSVLHFLVLSAMKDLTQLSKQLQKENIQLTVARAASVVWMQHGARSMREACG